MPKIIRFVMTLVMCWTAFGVSAAIDYNAIYSRLKDVPSVELTKMGKAYMNRNRTDSALAVFTIVANRSRSDMDADERDQVIIALNNIGIINFLNANYARAYSYFVNSIELNDVPDAIGYINLPAIYMYFGDKKKAYDCMKKVFDSAIQNRHYYNASVALVNIINIDLPPEEYASSRDLRGLLIRYKKGCRQTSDNAAYPYATALCDGMLKSLDGDHAGAIADFKASVERSRAMLVPERDAFSSFMLIGKEFEKAGQLDSALHYTNVAEQLAVRNAFGELAAEAYQRLSVLYGLKGDVARATEYKYKNLELRDSILSVDDFGKIRDLEMFHEVDKFTKEIDRLTLEDMQRRRVLAIVFSAAAVIAAMLVWMWALNKKLRRKNRDLFARNMEIMATERMAAEQPVQPNLAVAGETGDDTGAPAGGGGKYVSSNLSDDMKAELGKRISAVMEDEAVITSADFSLNDLSARVESNPKYVSQVLNELFGKSFPALLNERRVGMARERFVDFEHYGHLTIEAIISDLGFKSRSTFSKTFKGITGLTPTEFIRQAKAARSMDGKSGGTQ